MKSIEVTPRLPEFNPRCCPQELGLDLASSRNPGGVDCTPAAWIQRPGEARGAGRGAERQSAAHPAPVPPSRNCLSWQSCRVEEGAAKPRGKGLAGGWQGRGCTTCGTEREMAAWQSPGGGTLPTAACLQQSMRRGLAGGGPSQDRTGRRASFRLPLTQASSRGAARLALGQQPRLPRSWGRARRHWQGARSRRPTPSGHPGKGNTGIIPRSWGPSCPEHRQSLSQAGDPEPAPLPGRAVRAAGGCRGFPCPSAPRASSLSPVPTPWPSHGAACVSDGPPSCQSAAGAYVTAPFPLPHPEGG